ncbi:MAG: flagellar biosynthesis protein FliQ [Spirochaetes bacterium]|nr:flagellar biosynthesis protein FliQ [Spirochaetota bacterium]
MDQALLSEIMVKTVRLILMCTLPLLGSGMLIGLIIAIFQATTSIQEQTLTFVPKIIVIMIALILFGPWILNTLIDYTLQLFEILPLMALPAR